MARMTDEQLVAVACTAVAEHLRPMGRLAKRHDATLPEGVAGAARTARAAPTPPAADDAMIKDLARQVGAKLAKAEDNSADVEFVEHTPLGARATVVHVRDGKVARVIKRA